MLKKLAIAASLAILSSAAVAADAPSFYAGVDLGKTKVDNYSQKETSYGAFLGYNFNRHFAIEGGYRSLADFDMVDKGVKVDVDVTQLSLSGIAKLPVSDSFNVYGRLGYNRLAVRGKVGSFSAKDSENKALFGVGVGYDFSPTAQVRFEIQRPESDTTNASVGLSFKF